MNLLQLFRNFGLKIAEEVIIKPQVKSYACRKISDENTLLLVCHPRGGSNWLSEIMMKVPKSILIDEPLWRGYYRGVCFPPQKAEGKLVELSLLDFYYDQHIPPEEKWPEARTVMEKILQGSICNYHIWDKNKLSGISNAENFIIKLNYGHLLLPWLHQNFNMKSIVLHRHPCAVVSSQLQFRSFNKIPANVKGALPRFRGDSIYQKCKGAWDCINSPEEYLAAIWAIKTKYILDSTIEGNKSIQIFYEDLLMDFPTVKKYVEDHLRFGQIQLSPVSSPSSSTPNGSHLLQGEKQLLKWKKYLSIKQIKSILNIVDLFEVELYDDSPYPKK